MSPLRVVVALDSLKGSATASAAAAAVAAGWHEVRAHDDLVLLPLADGGEGTADALRSRAPAARRHPLTVTGPDGRPASTSWLALPDGTAVVETATTCGFTMGTHTEAADATSTGLGQALAAAARHPRTRRILVALGGSASTDGGAGALAALGARITAPDGAPIGHGGRALGSVADVDLRDLVAAPDGGVLCLSDVTAPLLGARGAARQFGPQKGAGPEEVALLEAHLERWAELLGGRPDAPGAGAAGGLGYALATAWGAELRDGATYLGERLGLGDQLAAADVVITGEGRFDRQSLQGKVVGHVLGAAAPHGVRPLLVCGQMEPGVSSVLAVGDVVELARLAGSAQRAMHDPERWLARAGRTLAARMTRGDGTPVPGRASRVGEET